MRVLMLAQISGTRNGRSWPGKGQTIDLPDEEAAQMCAAGLAETVKERPEKAVPKSSEKAEPPKAEVSETPKPEKRGPGRPRKTAAKDTSK